MTFLEGIYWGILFVSTAVAVRMVSTGLVMVVLLYLERRRNRTR